MVSLIRTQRCMWAKVDTVRMAK